jgi:hypothetical protein
MRLRGVALTEAQGQYSAAAVLKQATASLSRIVLLSPFVNIPCSSGRSTFWPVKKLEELVIVPTLCSCGGRGGAGAAGDGT